MITPVFAVLGGRVQEWGIVQSGRLINQEGMETDWVTTFWSGGIPAGFRLWNGDRTEVLYGNEREVDREVDYEDKDPGKVFFSLNREAAETRVTRLLEGERQDVRREELLRKHGLDEETVRGRRLAILMECGLLDETSPREVASCSNGHSCRLEVPPIK